MFLKRIVTVFIILAYACNGYAQGKKLLVPYRVKNTWGYSDTLGKMVITPAWDSAGLFAGWNFFNKNLAFVYTKGKQGIIDMAGRFVLEPKYEKLKYVFVDGGTVNAMFATAGNKYGLINYSGNIIIPVEYDTLQEYDIFYKQKEDIQFLGRQGNEYYKFDLAGKREKLPKSVFTEQSAMMTGLMPAIADYSYGNRKQVSIADTLAKYGFDSISAAPFKRSKFHLIYKKGKTGLWDKASRLIMPQFDEVLDYEGEVYSSKHKILARKDGKIGVMTPEGEILMPFTTYTEIFRWDGYRVYTKKGNKMGVYSLYSAADIKPKYDSIEPSSASHEFGLWKVTNDNKTGYINNKGFEYFRN